MALLHLQLSIVLCETLKVDLFGAQPLGSIFKVVRQLFLMLNRCVTFLLEALGRLRSGLEFISDLVEFTSALRVKVGVVTLESVHFALESGLFFSLDQTLFLVFDLAASHHGLQLTLLLV